MKEPPVGCPNVNDSFLVKSFSFPFSYHQMIKKTSEAFDTCRGLLFILPSWRSFLGFTIGNICRISVVDYKNDIKEKNSKENTNSKLSWVERVPSELYKLYQNIFRLSRPTNRNVSIFDTWPIGNSSFLMSRISDFY